MLYSFDDTAIGQSKNHNKTIDTREIPRPTGLAASEWYSHASAVCRILNENPMARQGSQDAWLEGSRLNFVLMDDPVLPKQEPGQSNVEHFRACRNIIDAKMMAMVAERTGR